MAFSLVGPIAWNGKITDEAHREYHVQYRVKGERGDGPAQAMWADGLPQPGSAFAVGNDVDLWAFCQPETDIKPDQSSDNELEKYFVVSKTFSTKTKRRCADHKVEDPLLEPAKVSGSTETKKEEAAYDMFGLPILTSSHEIIRGHQVEFEEAKAVINIEQNVPTFVQAFNLPNSMLNCVNAGPFWGLPPRTIRLSDLSWDQKYYGACNIYYTRKLKFIIDVKTWDRDVLDEGTKALNGHWNNLQEWVLDNINGQPPDPNNPKHFKQFTGRDGNPMRVILDGFGLPSGAQVGVLGDFVCIKKIPAGTIDLSDETYWIKQTAGVVEWVTGTTYQKGSVVEDLGELYIRNGGAANVDNDPSGEAGWSLLPTGLVTKGIWDIAVPYDIGDSVMDPENDVLSTAGKIHVAKYLPANFALLGIPLTF